MNVFDVKRKDKRKVRGNVNNHMAKWEQRDRKFRARRIRKAQRNRFREDGTPDYTQPKSFKQKKEWNKQRKLKYEFDDLDEVQVS